jgi:hypothetical protein
MKPKILFRVRVDLKKINKKAKKVRARKDLVIAVAARVEEDLLILIFLRVQNVVAKTFKK